jgi:hypothetical protein
MKRLNFMIVVAGLMVCMAAKAQNDVAIATLQHGNNVSVFKGPGALANALAAADEGGGDVISLSEGSFTAADITKPVSIYGAGFEKDNTNGTLLTLISGNMTVGRTDSELLSGVHIEGVYLDGQLKVGGVENKGPLKDFRVVKAFIMSMLVQSTNDNTSFDQCVINGTMNCAENNNIYKTVISDLFFSNCVMNRGCFRRYYHADNSIVLDHCIFNVYCNSSNSYGIYYPFENAPNTILTLRNSMYILASDSPRTESMYTIWPSGSKISNCISDDGNIAKYDGCHTVLRAEVFKDGEDGMYNSSRSFELNEQPAAWVATDGSEIGIRGGNGWSKVPSTPVVKNLSVTPDGTNLNVTYEAEVR